jgi:hypothetical protein
MNAEFLRELQDRGRFFYQRFPGAAAAEEWKQMREKAEEEPDNARSRDSDDPGTVKTR